MAVSSERLGLAVAAVVILVLVAVQMTAELRISDASATPKSSLSDLVPERDDSALVADLRAQVSDLQRRLRDPEPAEANLVQRTRTMEPLVRKTVSSDRLRFVFFAGVEGTGHHFWTALWPSCGSNCVASKNVTQLTANVQGASPNQFPGPSQVSDMSSQLRQSMSCLAGLGRNCVATDARLIVVNTHTNYRRNAGMMSYPNFGGNNKAIRHPDVHLLARLAEQAGVDLRVVVIIRDPASILVSTTINRNFNPFHIQLRVLADNQAILLQQLREIDRRFWVCHDFDADPQVACQALGEHMGVGRFPHPWDLCNEMTAMRKAADDRHKVDGKDPPKKDKREHFTEEELQMLDTFYRVYNATKAMCQAGPD